MADVPFPLITDEPESFKTQIWELFRQIYEEKIGGADLGDVFGITNDVLTLVLAAVSGLTKSGSELAVEVTADGGLQILSGGLAIKIVATGGLETSASGTGIKLDGTTLSLSASGLKVNTNPNYTVVTHVADTVLTSTDMKKIHIFDVATAGADLTATLPSVAAANLGDWIILVRVGTANTLFVYAADADTILDSSAGGTIECSDATYDLSTFAPWLLTATRWGAGPGCFGIWGTR